MFELILQLHAHKKGTGSSHNGRDSNSQRLGTKAPTLSASAPKHMKASSLPQAASSFVSVVPASIPATM